VIEILRVYKNTDTLVFMLNDSHKKSELTFKKSLQEQKEMKIDLFYYTTPKGRREK
jgi:hypothetical protein